MTISDEQAEVVRQTIIEMFGEENVREIDMKWMALHDIRISSDHNYDFLAKIREQYQESEVDANTLIAAVLYGIRLGEIGREYAYEQERVTGAGVEYQ